MKYQDFQDYLNDHTINEASIKKFELTGDDRKLNIPVKDANGILRFTKERCFEGKKFYIPAKTKTILFNSSVLKDNPKYILIAAGEIDCIRLNQEGLAAVSSTSGEGTFKAEWVDQVREIPQKMLCLDNDLEGIKATTKLLFSLPDAKVIQFPTGIKDTCDYFKHHTKDDFRVLFKSALTREEFLDKYPEDERKNSSGTETPHSPVTLIKQKLIEQPLAYKEVEARVIKLLPNSQTALKLVLAVAVSSSFPNPVMLWLLLVGVPSSGKTDIVRLVKEADTTYYLDNLTQNAFISGERESENNKVYDLLPLLDKKCLVIKDWTAIFSLDEKMTKKLLGDLVGIYDKEFVKFSSARGNVGYTSAFSQLGCITPATLNRHTNYMNMVGPRFLCYSMPSSTSEEDNQSYEQIFSNQDRSAIEKETRLYVSSYLAQLVKKTPNIKPLPNELQQYLRTAAELMANCRGIVILQSASFRNEEGNDTNYYEVLDVQIEQPWRAVQQLITLVKYLAFVVGKDEVGVDELAIIKEVVLSSMPADRSQALRAIKDQEGSVTAKALTESSERSVRTSRRLLDELVALKVLDKIKGTGTIANDYKIYPRFQDFLLLTPAEFMSHKEEDSGTETRDGIETPKERPW